MKKLVCMLAALALLCAAATAETAFVSISNGAGEIVLANEPIEVTDADGDGALTICDALHCAHEAKFEGGAEAGFGTGDQGYGLSLTRLWGEENGGSYGYHLNDASALSLTDPIADGDYLNAYVFTDLEAWSDVYCCFDRHALSAKAGETFALTLTAQIYDADWNVVPTPVNGAHILIDGEESEFVTDADGKVELSFAEAGEHVLSARADDQVLVPPVCTAAIEAE